MNLSVGDVIFVLDKKTKAVVPCQLVERISSVTLTGEEIRNIVSTPSGKNFNLEEYESPWFDSYDSAEKYLLNAAIELVSSTMKRAEEVAVKAFGHSSKNLDPPISESSLDSEDVDLRSKEKSLNIEETDQVFVDIGGQQVKVTLPKELINE